MVAAAGEVQQQVGQLLSLDSSARRMQQEQ